MESIKGELMDRYVLSKDEIFALLEERLDPIPLQQAA
jgi:cell division protease FtsH